MVEVKIVTSTEAGDPLDNRLRLVVTDGQKSYRYEHERQQQYNLKDLARLFGVALDDLVYHDGEKGRVR